MVDCCHDINSLSGPVAIRSAICDLLGGQCSQESANTAVFDQHSQKTRVGGQHDMTVG